MTGDAAKGAIRLQAQDDWLHRGEFVVVIAGRMVRVFPSWARPDIGPDIYAVPGDGGVVRHYVRGPRKACDVTVAVAHDLALRLAESRRAAVPRPVLTDEDARAQHAAGVELVPTEESRIGARRMQRMFDRLYARGTLDARHLSACQRLLNDYEAGVEGASIGATDWGREPVDGGRRDGLPSVEYGWARLEALKRYQSAVKALGPRVSHLVLWVVIEDRSVEAYARRATGDGIGSKEDARHWTGALKLALSLLADHYGEPGSDIKKVS